MKTHVWVALSMISILGVSLAFAGDETKAKQAARKPEPAPAAAPVFIVGDSRLEVVRADVEQWKRSYGYALSEAAGTLVGATLNFTDSDVIGVSYAIDYRNAARSDIALSCGDVRINPFKLAKLDGGKMRVDRPGGFFQKDGRMGSIAMAVGSMTLTFFFDVPAECAGRELVLHLRFDDGAEITTPIGNR